MPGKQRKKRKMDGKRNFSNLKVEAEESEGEFETEEIIEEPVAGEIEQSTSGNIKKSKPVIVQMSSNGLILKNSLDTSEGVKEIEDSSSQNTDGSKQKWTRESTHLLISLRTELDEHFENPKCKKMDYWDYISTIMGEAGYQISSHDCHTKWRNLCGTYRMNKEKSQRLGYATIRWEFFEPMDKFMKKKRWVSSDPSLKDLDNLDDDEEEDESDDDLEMSRLLRLQSGVSEKRSFDTSCDPPFKRVRSDSPPQWFKDYIKTKEEEEKLRDERFFSILESIKESEMRKTALLESLLQYFDRS